MADDANANGEAVIGDPPINPGDVEMAEGTEGAENADAGEGAGAGGDATELPFLTGDDEAVPTRVPFIDYLASPIVTLLVGPPGAEMVLSAHQALLAQSDFLARACAALSGDDGVPSQPRQLHLPDEETDAVGCFLEYLYTGDYFPKKLPGQRTLETDASLPDVDETGEQLLKHARVYTLAEKWGLEALKSIATGKIHCVNSTAKGEITYARYIYQNTTPDDATVRAPVAYFWSTRSHTLRSEAEDEFRALCLDIPQFGYDVLTRVLDDKLKREKNDKMHPAPGSGRKRARHSNI